MYNDLQILKSRLGIYPESLELDDTTLLPDENGQTAFQMYLEQKAEAAAARIAGWLAEGSTIADATLQAAELLVVQSEIVLDYGIQEAVLPTEIAAGGSNGERVRIQRMNHDEREERARHLADRAWVLINGAWPAHTGVA